MAAAAAAGGGGEAEEANPIVRYLTRLDEATLSELYRDSFTCLTLFRSLPPLAKQYVLRLLPLAENAAVPAELVDAWPRAGGRPEALHASALARLGELGIVDRAGGGVALRAAFQRSLHEALANRVPAQPTQKKEKNPPSLAELDAHGSETWETILHYMVGQRFRGAEPQPRVRELLLRSGLMEPDARGGEAAPHQITREGFRFLFDSTPRQIWRLVTGYMGTLGGTELRPGEVLSFLFRLSFLKAGGEDYSTEPLTPSQRVLLTELNALGLVWMRKPTSSRFYLTRLALNLSSSPAAGLTSAAAAQGHIIVETTFKVYAYTASSLQTSLIGMFCRLDCRLPNAIVGRITKRSVRRALKSGLRAREIVHYLEHCAHPQMRARAAAGSGRALPDNVADQIELWEHERHRFSLTAGHLITNFSSDAEWKEACRWARAKGMFVHAACRPRDNFRGLVISVVGDNKRDFQTFWRARNKRRV